MKKKTKYLNIFFGCSVFVGKENKTNNNNNKILILIIEDKRFSFWSLFLWINNFQNW